MDGIARRHGDDRIKKTKIVVDRPFKVCYTVFTMKNIEQTDLFDLNEPNPAPAWKPSWPVSSWREVPQARFLSWSPARQLSYCALRDEDSAKYALDSSWAEFYTNRAKMYKEMLNELNL